MKKVIFGTALASMALLSACSSDNELANVETTANNAIGFHVVGNKAETRANIINTTEDLKKTDFNVFAYKYNNGADGEIFMGDKENDDNHLYGVRIKYETETNKWVYNDPNELRYWPTTALNFYAVNPGSTNIFSWNFTNEKKQITYACSDEYVKNSKGEYYNHKNIDAMYAVTKNQTQTNNDGFVKFNFKHILSQVVFQAKTQYANMEVEIKALSIHNFYWGGTFTIPEGEPSQKDWAPTTISYQPKGFTAVMDESIKVAKTDEVTNISTQGPMLFIPQKLTEWDLKGNIDATTTAKQSYLKITCKIKQSGAYLFGGDTTFDELYVPFKADWQPGKRYIYTLIFGGGYDKDGHSILKPINFEADVEAWDENTTNNSDININK
ncbi:fimbrillin family protein [Prevotella sp. AM23-5]|uniref:fimbrillin family protein n=1 Tax=Prevotellaceae TaxID=171552 RepID=UPI000E47E41F|nr:MULTISPECIES: fimbrillin family protein [Prevotellaceae]RHN98702.1 fimbrillin family protein [Prevotella sp. AM23-5]